MNKKTILITGSTDGIGKLAAIQLAEQGHYIILHGRNVSKINQLVDEIKIESKNTNIHGYRADLSQISEIENFISQINSNHQSLDCLLYTSDAADD